MDNRDFTSVNNPDVFWVNNDVDRWHTVDRDRLLSRMIFKSTTVRLRVGSKCPIANTRMGLASMRFLQPATWRITPDSGYQD